MVENIIYGGKTLARIIRAEELDGPFKFFTEDSDNIQISRWNHPCGYRCKAHVHNITNKVVNRTHEAIFVINGELRVTIYTLEGRPVQQKMLYPLDIFYAMDCGHEYEVMDDGTRVVEFKNGPFLGDDNYDLERTLIDPNNFYLNEKV